MFYVDTQRTVTRRESSLITSRRYSQDDRYDFDGTSTARGPSTVQLNSESNISLTTRPKGSVEKELVTAMFEAMLPTIVRSWDVIVEQKPEEMYPQMPKISSDVTVSGREKKKKPANSSAVKISKSKSTKSRSKLDIAAESGQQIDPMTIVWWAGPDEKVVIRFKNGNKYEGKLSYKCMHGEGRFEWADGTVYLGEFKDNVINGKGMIQWKNDTWYQGGFAGNLRHGTGLFVDSRAQKSYNGGWYCGTKHGKGAMHFDLDKNYYDGDWVHNVRHGFGTREYCQMSGYQGEWDRYVREGKGLMIWPNHDFYKGEWKNGIMSGYGIYIWDAYYNNSLSLPSINMYRGRWFKGERNGYGVLHLGLGLGSHYKGEFKDNKKHGSGKFITNNGHILKGKRLYIDDNMGPVEVDEVKASQMECSNKRTHPNHVHEPYDFNICDSTAGLSYHVKYAFNNIDRAKQFHAEIVNEYIENNKYCESDFDTSFISIDRVSDGIDDDLIEFEVTALRKAVRCYEIKLKEIYYTYATICNTEEINFTPILIRLFLWQFFYDCDIHEKGLTLVQIDNIYAENPDWLAKLPHGPFERIYLWQFLHSLISIANYLYSKRYLPGPRPETILANAFRYFMENDAIPNMGRCKGRLTQTFGSFIPLKASYKLYKTLGEPHTVRDFLCAVRVPPSLSDEQPDLVEAPETSLPMGRNIYIFGDNIYFVQEEHSADKNAAYVDRENMHLFNFGNLSSKTIIKIFSNIFPNLCDGDKLMDLDIQITFFEFFEAFLICAEESNRVREEELRWREMFEENSVAVVAPPTPTRKTK